MIPYRYPAHSGSTVLLTFGMIASVLLLAAAPAAAQIPGVRPAPEAKQQSITYALPGRADPLGNAFFPPELVMQHQQRIGLTGEQRAEIIRAIQEAQPRFIEAQWQLEPETAALADMVRAPRIDQQRVLAQIDRVLDIERRIKRAQLELLIQIKNQLTEQQQTELARLAGPRGVSYFQPNWPDWMAPPPRR